DMTCSSFGWEIRGSVLDGDPGTAAPIAVPSLYAPKPDRFGGRSPERAAARRQAARPRSSRALRRPNRGTRRFGLGFVEIAREESAGLVPPERGIKPAAREQLFVRAALDDAPVVHHDEPIHRGNRRQAMRDRDHGLVPP